MASAYASQPYGAATLVALFLATLVGFISSSSLDSTCPWGEPCEDQGASEVSLLQVTASKSNLTSEASHIHRHKRHFRRHRAIGDAASHVKAHYPFYHTTDEIAKEVKGLMNSCGGSLYLKTISKENVSIDVATVRKQGSSPVNRVFFLFGEHSRELISPESGLHLLKTMCHAIHTGKKHMDSEAKANKVDILSVLDDSEFQMVLNGNPVSRKKVEGGEYCLRTNQNGVDLNRNWDEMWAGDGTSGSDTNPGPKPFSEAETRIFKDLVSEYNPTTFVTVHSGTRGMYMPWAYDMKHLAKRNAPEMMQVLKSLDKEHCQCPYGAAGKEVGYPCPGTCLDWVYDKLNTPYVFAFEIYTDDVSGSLLTQRWKDKLKSGGSLLLQSGNHLGHKHFLDVFHEHRSDFVQTKANLTQQRQEAEDYCFAMFNPDTADKYQWTIENWSAVYLKMAQQLAANIRQHDKRVNSSRH